MILGVCMYEWAPLFIMDIHADELGMLKINPDFEIFRALFFFVKINANLTSLALSCR